MRTAASHIAGAARGQHLLKSTPETVHWGFYDAELKPVLSIDAGDRVTIECITGSAEWLPPAGSGMDPLLSGLLTAFASMTRLNGASTADGRNLVRARGRRR